MSNTNTSPHVADILVVTDAMTHINESLVSALDKLDGDPPLFLQLRRNR